MRWCSFRVAFFAASSLLVAALPIGPRGRTTNPRPLACRSPLSNSNLPDKATPHDASLILMKRTIYSTFLSLSMQQQSFRRDPSCTSPPTVSRSTRPIRPSLLLATTKESDSLENSNDGEVKQEHVNVRAPLKFIGPYPCLGVRFPELATAAQRERNETGVTLDFVLDTAANTNTINLQVAQALNLTIVGQAAPGMGSAGPIEGDLPTFLLGDMQLEGLGEGIFMQNVIASALPIASPASAGLLSLAFFQSIGDGAGFDWHGDASASIPPSLTFYADASPAIQGRRRVEITNLPVTQLPSVQVEINGQRFPALLDTGSPITVLNAQAAEQAGIAAALETNQPSSTTKKQRNPLLAFKDRFEQAQAASQGKILTIFGAGGKRINLIQSREPLEVGIPTVDNDCVNFGRGHVFIGELPGLAALQGLGDNAPPAIVLGMDVLRRNRYMIFRPLDNEVWF